MDGFCTGKDYSFNLAYKSGKMLSILNISKCTLLWLACVALCSIRKISFDCAKKKIEKEQTATAGEILDSALI